MAAAVADSQAPLDREGYLKMANYALIKQSDMNEEMRVEAVEICASAVEKFADNYEKAAQSVKDGMDRKFGAPWNVVIGEYFSFEITYEVKNLLYLFMGGTKGILLWKSQ